MQQNTSQRRVIFWGALAGIVVVCSGLYWYLQSEYVPVQLENKLKHAEMLVREKIAALSEEISAPGPLFGNTQSNDSILTENGIYIWTNVARNNNSDEQNLTRNTQLDDVARRRVDDMFAKQYFEHVSPTGESASDEAEKVGYEYISIGENIALGNFENDETLVDAWMNSPGHRANIVSDSYTQIGVAAKKSLYDGDEIWIAVQIFGRPLSDCAEPSTILKKQIETKQALVEEHKANADILFNNLQQPGQSAQEYNTKAEEYNAQVRLVNSLIAETKALIVQYNTEVSSFNTCIEA